MRRFKQALAASVATVGILTTVPALAQRVVVFGDSLSDTGNAALATNNASPGSPLGRFSNGLNWVDLLYGPTTPGLFTGATKGNIDYALGGALTTATATPLGSIGNVGVLSNPMFPNISVANEISAFKAVGGTFAANDTVTLWGGANNFFAFSGLTPQANLAATYQANAFGSASSEIANAAALVAAGAKKVIVVNLPDLGSTPSAIASGPSAVSLASAWTGVFNATLAGGLGQLAVSAPGVNIIQADVASLFRVVIANAGAFGFNNTTTFCGFKGGAACAGFVFADSVHPTQAAYAYVAQYVGLLTNTAPALQQVARLSEVGVQANELVTNQVFDRLSAFTSGTYVDRNGPYAEIIGSYGTYDGRNGTSDLTLQVGGVRAGLDKKSGATLTGASMTLLSGGVTTGAVKSDLTAYRADIYGTALFGNAYISGDAGISSVTLAGIVRQTGLPTVTANGHTGGYVASAAAEVGYLQNFGGITLIPSARLSYFHSELNGYSESGDLLTMNYNDRTTDAVLLGGKVRAVTNVPGVGLAATAFGEIGYEGFVSSSTTTLTGQLIGNTAVPTTVTAGDLNGPGIVGKVGLSSEITQGTFIDFQYGLSLHDGGGETHSGDIRLKATY